MIKRYPQIADGVSKVRLPRPAPTSIVVENLRSVLKQNIYEGGRQFTLTEARRMPDTEADLALKALGLIIVCTCPLQPPDPVVLPPVQFQTVRLERGRPFLGGEENR